MEHEEYTAENYPSFGKKYNGEKAIISITSWKRRIDTVSKTIFSIIKECPGFHIVLVLSEEEFPKMTEDLPEHLMTFVNNELIELMFVYKNYGSYKKVFFTMDKYKNLDIPIISADDGCYYIKNFAEDLYKSWELNKKHIHAFMIYWSNYTGACGSHGICYPPNAFKHYAIKILKDNYKLLMKNQNDDRFTGILSKFLHIKWKQVKMTKNHIDLRNSDKTAMRNLNKYIAGSNWKFISIIKKYFK